MDSTGYNSYWNFNSRPHEEVDQQTESYPSSTAYFNSRPHEEVDDVRLKLLFFYFYFNSRPHEEVDQFCKLNSVHLFFISTHDLTRRSTPSCACVNDNVASFQLTTSRGGRLHAVPVRTILLSFQLTTSRGGRQ